MTEKRKSPALRFRGYTDDWEQRKLGELVIAHNAGIYISKEDYGEGTNVIGVGNIYDRDIFGGEIYRLGPVNDDKFILEENDILYGESSLVPEGIARTVCVGKNGAGSAFAWHTRRVKLDKNIVNSHVATLELNYHHDIRKYLVSVSTQTALTGMTTEGYFGATLTFPSVEEQQKISDYFKNLDNLITLHQRKLEKLKLVKKSMLEKMFPKNGSSVPEIRFNGFTDDWEQRKFGDLYTTLTERNAELLPYSRTLSVATMEYKTSGNGAADSSLANYKRLRIGDIAFEGHTSGEFRYGRFVLNDTGDGIMSPRFSALRPLVQMPTKFWKYYIHYEPIMRNVLVNSTKAGTMMNELVVDEFLNSSILVPSEGEQTYIGNALTTFDNLITLHQRKVEKLQILKKSMLEKMFV